MGGNERVFMSAVFNKSFTQYLSIWSTVGTFHNLSSDAALLFLIEKKFLYFILQAKCLQMRCKCRIRLLMLGGKKKACQMLYLSGSSFSSFHVWLNVSPFQEPPKPLSWTFLIPKLLFLSTMCAAEALKDIKASPRWRTLFDNAGLDTYWPVRISCLLR